jgi:signal transduction histidine kinase
MNLLRNLIGNALKYTEKGGLMISIRRRGRRGLVQVLDTGIGIAPQPLGNIFEEDFQAGNPERDRT